MRTRINEEEMTNKIKSMDAVLNKNTPKRELRMAYAKVADEAIDLSIREQALKEALCEIVGINKMADIMTVASANLENQLWNGISKEDRKALEEYGYNKPIFPVTGVQASAYFDNDVPVYLLYHNGEKRKAVSLEEIKLHSKNGMLGIEKEDIYLW